MNWLEPHLGEPHLVAVERFELREPPRLKVSTTA
jgi:hypothetical protein